MAMRFASRRCSAVTVPAAALAEPLPIENDSVHCRPPSSGMTLRTLAPFFSSVPVIQSPIPAIATFLQAEHPQTAAVILSEMRAEIAASVGFSAEQIADMQKDGVLYSA